MITTKKLGLLAIVGALVASPVFANGLQEDRAWQFDNSTRKFYLLNAEALRLKVENDGFKQIFNVSADGASTVYVGNNSQTWVADDQTNNTSVGNMTSITLGDGATGNTVTNGQDNTGSQDAVGASLNGDGGFVVGESVSGVSGVTNNITQGGS